MDVRVARHTGISTTNLLAAHSFAHSAHALGMSLGRICWLSMAANGTCSCTRTSPIMQRECGSCATFSAT